MKFKFDASDVLVVGGLLILGIGLWVLSPWLALAAAGYGCYRIGIAASER